MPKVADSYLEARKRSILDAAIRVFSQKGVQTATMADIAREAEISPGAIYRYFDSKEALALGCFDENAATIHNEWLHAPEPTDEPGKHFADLSRATLALLETPANEITTVLDMEAVVHAVRDDPDRRAELCHQIEQVVAGIASRLDAMQRAGELAADVDIAMLARALFSFYWGARVTRLLNPESPVLGQLESLMKVMEASARKP
jgi:AcrR family transcriptional regulator